MLVIGVASLFAFAYWDMKVAKRPVLPPRFIRNRSVVFASFVGFFDFVSLFAPFTVARLFLSLL